MRRTYEWKIKTCPCGCRTKRGFLSGIELTAWQQGTIGLDETPATVHVSNLPIRGWREVFIKYLTSDTFMDEGEWCRDGFKKAGIIPKAGGSLWVKVVKEAVK